MASIKIGEIELNSVGKAIFEDVMIHPRPERDRTRKTITIDTELLEKYEEHNPRMKGGRYSGEGLSSTINKALTVYMTAFDMM